jgi:hypothetical protein
LPEQASEGITKCPGRPPADAAKYSGPQAVLAGAAQAEQVVTTVRTGAQDGVTNPQLAERLAEHSGPKQRRVRTYHHHLRMTPEKPTARVLQTLAQVGAALAK